MKHEHKVGIIAILVVVTTGTILLTRQFSHSPQSPNPQEKKAANEVFVHSVFDREGTPYTTVSLEYPEFDESMSVLNQAIKGYVDATLVEFKKNSEENWKARVATQAEGEAVSEYPKESEKMTLNGNWSDAQINSSYISLSLQIYQFSGGAHGSTVIRTFNYDVKENRLVTLRDLYPDTPDYLEKVSSAAVDSLRAQYKDSMFGDLTEDFKRGTGPLPENFEAFTFDEFSITIYFQQYQVGPYALGMPQVKISRK